MVSGGIVAAGVATKLHPGPLVVMRRLSMEEASHYYSASGTRLEADPVPLRLVK